MHIDLTNHEIYEGYYVSIFPSDKPSSETNTLCVIRVVRFVEHTETGEIMAVINVLNSPGGSYVCSLAYLLTKIDLNSYMPISSSYPLYDREYSVDDFELGYYRHHKNNWYKADRVVRCLDNGEYFVIYQAMYDECGWYARPYEMFIENITKEQYPNAKQNKRFMSLNELRDCSPKEEQTALAIDLLNALKECEKSEEMETLI